MFSAVKERLNRREHENAERARREIGVDINSTDNNQPFIKTKMFHKTQFHPETLLIDLFHVSQFQVETLPNFELWQEKDGLRKRK